LYQKGVNVKSVVPAGQTPEGGWRGHRTTDWGGDLEGSEKRNHT